MEEDNLVKIILEINQEDDSNILLLETTNEQKLKISCYDGDWGNIWLDKNEVKDLVDNLNLWLAEQNNGR